MPRTSAGSGWPTGPGSAGEVGGRFSPGQWRLLTRLPAEVMTAMSVHEDGTRTVAEGLAGLDAIAAGRGSTSDLVRAVVAGIYSQPASPAPAAADPRTHRSRVLEDCRRAGDILRASAEPADAAAYRGWVRQVAKRVGRASRSGGVFGLRDDLMAAAEKAFLERLEDALS